MTAPPGGEQPLEVWRGAVNPWRCDPMGRMNMRFYLAIAEEGLAGLATALGQPRAFAPGAVSTLRLRGCHVRFLREGRVGDSLYATAGVLEMGEDEARLLQVIRHGDGGPAAAVTITAEHVTPDGRPFAWSARARAAAERLICARPDEAAPRGVAMDDRARPSLERAEALGLRRVARGAVMREECDALDRMTASAIFGRVADGMALLMTPLRTAAAQAFPDRRIGGAALEYVLELARTPRAGDLFEVRSGLARVEERVLHLRHWLLDPARGEAYGVLRGVGATLDLDARRLVPLPPTLQTGFETPGLA